MSPSVIGLLAGLVAGVISCVMILRIARTRTDATTATLFKVIGLADLVVMPAIGWAIGAFVFEGAA